MSYDFQRDCKTVMTGKKKGGVAGSLTTLMSAIVYQIDHPDHTVLIIDADTTTFTLASYFSRLSIQKPTFRPPVHFRQWSEGSGVPLATFAILKAQEFEADAMFIDMPPNASVLTQAIGLASLIIAPTNVEGVDCEKVFEVKALADQFKKPMVCLLTRMREEGKGKARLWRAQFEYEKIKVSPTEVKAHSRYGNVLGVLREVEDEIKVEWPTDLGVYRQFGRDVSTLIGREVPVPAGV